MGVGVSGEEAGKAGCCYTKFGRVLTPWEGVENSLAIPVRILVADGHCRKRHTLLEVDADVDVLWIGDEIADFSCNHVREDSARRQDDQQPRESNNSQSTHATCNPTSTRYMFKRTPSLSNTVTSLRSYCRPIIIKFM